MTVVLLLAGGCQGGVEVSPVVTVAPTDDEVAAGTVGPVEDGPVATRVEGSQRARSASTPPASTASAVISAGSAGPAESTSPTPVDDTAPTAIADPLQTPQPDPAVQPAPTGAASPSPVDPPPTAVPAFVPVRSEPDIPVPPDRDLQDLGKRLVEGYVEPKTIVPSDPFVVGQKVNFWVLRDTGSVLVSGEVAYVSEHAYWIFENGFVPDPAVIAQVAERFESEVWAAVTGVFGPPLTPGIDGDDRIVVYHAVLRTGVAGYFSASDSYPSEILVYSNQREALYMSANRIRLTSTEYLSVIAHELQHASHFAADSSEDSWVNEGLSEIAVEIAGFARSAVSAFVRSPSTSLIGWAQEIAVSSANYGAANLFFAFLASHYGGRDMLTAVIRNQDDGIVSIDSALAEQGFDVGANDVFADWVVANYLSADEGPYSYDDRSVPPVRNRYKRAPDSVSGQVRGYGADYIVTSTGSGRMTLEFQGQPETALLIESPHSGSTCWWSNQGDNIDSTLTRTVDLRSVETATLRFWTLYDIEELWDFAYVMVSTDGGETWQILHSTHSATMNPYGNAYGPGLTGRSDGWVQDSADLSEYAGQQFLLRFEYVTDDAVFSKGACFDDFEIPEIGWSDDTSTRGDWTANGFALVEEMVPTQYLVQVIHEKKVGDPVIYRLPVDAQGAGRLVVEGIGEDDLIVAVISAVTRHSTTPTEYTLSITP